MHLYEDQFSENHDFPRVESPSKVLIIASTGRGGSHMLGHALYKTNKFGFPLEYANPANLAEWKRRLEVADLQAAMAEIQRRRTSPNGVFGVKIHYPHISQFGGFNNLMKAFPNAYYILLSRSDALSQAVSLSIARQTGVWIAGQKSINDNPQYNFSDINNCLRETIINNASWRYTLAANGCNYIEMDFDYIRQNVAQSIKNIGDFIDIEIDSGDIPHEQATNKQSGRRNAEWAARFAENFDNSERLIKNVELDLKQKIKKKLKTMILR